MKSRWNNGNHVKVSVLVLGILHMNTKFNKTNVSPTKKRDEKQKDIFLISIKFCFKCIWSMREQKFFSINDKMNNYRSEGHNASENCHSRLYLNDTRIKAFRKNSYFRILSQVCWPLQIDCVGKRQHINGLNMIWLIENRVIGAYRIIIMKVTLIEFGSFHLGMLVYFYSHQTFTTFWISNSGHLRST